VDDLQDLRPDYSDDLNQAVDSALTSEWLPSYIDPPGYVRNFAESGLDDEWDERAEELVRKHVERVRRETMTDLADDRWESVVAIDTKTGEQVFRRYGSRSYTFLQEENRKMVEGREIALIHNHPNDTAASQADLDGAFWLGAKSLTIVTPSGFRYVYIRGAQGMELAAVINDPNYVTTPSRREDVESRAAYEAQLLAEAGNPAEIIMRQDQPSAVIEVSGSFRSYSNEWDALDTPDEDETFITHDFSSDPPKFRLLGKSVLNHSLVLVEMINPSPYYAYKRWIDFQDPDLHFSILDSSLETLPIIHARQSIIADETLDIELIWEDPTWPDKSGVGVRSRDFNPVGPPQEFLLQSPTIGPDVIVEFVATGHYQLGNYVVISFPASVFQENELIMRRLSDDKKNHDPSQWREDGRIFVAFAHLSDWEEWKLSPPQPGTKLNSPEKGIIGMTGNTGTVASHLDLSVMYYGSADDGTQQMAQALKDVRWDEASVDAYFGLAQRSSLVGDPRLYGENLDPVRIWPELDELEAAEYEKGESIYPWKN